jgi:hypothetical protein
MGLIFLPEDCFWSLTVAAQDGIASQCKGVNPYLA